MVDFRPFRGWRPPPAIAEKVAAVPYDVVDTAEARELARGRPMSLLHVTRPEIDLPEGTPIHADEVYAQGKRAWDALLAKGGLVHDGATSYYVYAQRMGDHRQVGIVGLASADEYWADKIKKHEHTRPDKEDDRKRHVETIGAHVGPVFLTYRAQAAIDRVVRGIVDWKPETEFVAHDGVQHMVWPVTDIGDVAAIQKAFAEVPALYIADGHHRAAAAARIAKEAPEGSPARSFLAVAFPDDQLQILPYYRVVADLAGLTTEAFLQRVGARFDVEPAAKAVEPRSARTFGMRLGERWYKLRWRDVAALEKVDPVGRLDVSLLQDHVLGPVLGIADPRRDKRIDFVGGIRGPGELEKRVGAGAAVAFTLYPTSLDELMEIADAGQVMPPKSTWFEPKLRSGLIVNRFVE